LLDDLLTVVREFQKPNVSHLELDRCLRRHDVGNLHAKKVRSKQSAFNAYSLGYIHIGVKCLSYLIDSMRVLAVPSRTITLTLGDLRCSWQDRF
jgi:hypothetical protein